MVHALLGTRPLAFVISGNGHCHETPLIACFCAILGLETANRKKGYHYSSNHFAC